MNLDQLGELDGVCGMAATDDDDGLAALLLELKDIGPSLC